MTWPVWCGSRGNAHFAAGDAYADLSGTRRVSRNFRAAGSGEQYPLPKEIEFCPAKHLALDHLQAVHLPFGLAVAPG